FLSGYPGLTPWATLLSRLTALTLVRDAAISPIGHASGLRSWHRHSCLCLFPCAAPKGALIPNNADPALAPQRAWRASSPCRATFGRALRHWCVVLQALSSKLTL